MIARLDRLESDRSAGRFPASNAGRSPAREREGATAMAGRGDSRLHSSLSFLIGLFLPVLTFRTEYVGTPNTVWDRIALVDVLLIFLLASWAFVRRFERLPAFSIFYLAAIGFGAVRFFALSMQLDMEVWTGVAAMGVAFGYYVLGLNFGSRPGLLRWFLLGLALSALGEAVIVYHDFLSPAQWFADPMEGRSRGTFKASGQLAAYSFSAAGMLLVLGEPTFGRRRRLAILAGLVVASFGILASRRSAMIVMVVWVVLVLFFAWPFRRRVFYRVLAGGSVLVTLGALLLWPQVSTSFAAKRLEDGFKGLAAREGFIQDQFAHTMGTASEWFPWGFGPGKGKLINREDLHQHEVHNGLLAVTVELGVAGLVAFLGVVLGPLFRLRALAKGGRDGVLTALIASFLLTSLVFMIHNTLYRDRSFLLFLGILTVIVRQRASRSELEREARPV